MSNKMVKCKTCGNEIAKNAKVCPHCGAKNKKPFSALRIFLIILLIIWGAGVIDRGFSGSSVSDDATEGGAANAQSGMSGQSSIPDELQPGLYKSNCTEVFNYLDLQRNPSDHTGLKLKTTVTVAQLVDGGFLDFSSYYRCYDAGENEYVILDDRESSEPKIIKDDTITIYGEFKGTQEGTRTFTQEKAEIPMVSAKYIDILD